VLGFRLACDAVRLEGGKKSLSRCLGISDQTRGADRNWGKMLASIKNEIDRRWPTTAHRMNGDGQFFENNYAALAAMRNPWRNSTMHFEQIYTEQDARDLLAIVGAFMRGLASRMEENGDPLA
jgi:hypothetical protein